ncbi:DUF397 domain-containing protein [Nocardia sp. SYP-A9097]|uniref:DUF397 domain-containing protein n=1 Tax=Nocardia sp. SYP-A9097 TaxID=2663237 RepID=UPI001329DA3A|nr:DUF397 domain-containing protein [Nocardia sp. SYP-A9097]MRH87001.1 DUF397 domain-containing protein [Nocardia sp. SYP-A9097]
MTNNPPSRRWFKSSRSAQGNECLEVYLDTNRVGVRDSKNPGGPELFFTNEQWDRFLGSDIWDR